MSTLPICCGAEAVAGALADEVWRGCMDLSLHECQQIKLDREIVLHSLQFCKVSTCGKCSNHMTLDDTLLKKCDP